MSETIGKKELVEQVEAKVGNVPKLHRIISAVFDTVQENLANGNEVEIYSFGKFKVVGRAERKGRNPKTGEELTIPARNVPVFTPSKTFKKLVN